MKATDALRAIEVLIEGVAVVAAIFGVLYLARWVAELPVSPEAPAEALAGQVVRRLELRLSEPLDKGRGDRYRIFECKEVPRGRPATPSRDASPGGAVRPAGVGQSPGGG